MKKTNKILITLSIIISSIYSLFFKEINLISILQLISFSIVIIFPIKINDNIRFVYIVFMYLAFLLGAILNLYNLIYWYDSLVHFLFGIITSFIAIIILDKYKLKNNIFNLLFILLTTFSLAVIWELIEFSLDNIFSLDIQKVKSTGVNDTMKDVVCAFMGSLLFVMYYLKNKQKVYHFVEQK